MTQTIRASGVVRHLQACRCLAALALAFAVAGPAAAQTNAEPPDEAETAFRSAFSPEVGPTERVAALERLAKEHPDSKWADDALWVLGEAARQQGLPQRVVYYWQFLMARRPDVDLQGFTCGLDVYKASGLPQVARYLHATGMGYLAEQGVDRREGVEFVNAKPFNPLPMSVWQGLARSYESLGRPELALKAYRAALAAAPAGGPWVQAYQKSVDRLEMALRARANAPAPKAKGPAAGVATAPPSTLAPASPVPAAGESSPEGNASAQDAPAPAAGSALRRRPP